MDLSGVFNEPTKRMAYESWDTVKTFTGDISRKVSQDPIVGAMVGKVKEAGDWYATHPNALLISLVGCVVLIAVVLAYWHEPPWRKKKQPATTIVVKKQYKKPFLTLKFSFLWKRKKARRMDKKEQDLFIKYGISGLVTEFLEEAEYQNLITREKVNEWYQRIGNVCTIPDLLPRQNGVMARTLKERIKARRGNGLYKPVSIPDEPGQYPVSRKRKRTEFDAFLQNLPQKA